MITKQKLLAHLKNDIYVRIKRSPIHGVGLFAIRDIPKGIDPFETLIDEPDITFSKKELKAELPKEVYEIVTAYCAEENGKVFIPVYGFNPIDILYLINHSEDPNIATTYDGSTFTAVRDIKKGEELFSDFSVYHDGSENYIRVAHKSK